MALSDFEQLEDRWRLLIEGGEVVGWRPGEVELVISWPTGRGRDAEERVEVSAASETSRIEGEITVGARVQDFVLWKDGRLSVVLDGARLEVEPASDYEAWEIRGPGLVVAPTSTGELPSIWVGDGDDPVLTHEEALTYLNELDARVTDGANEP